MSYKKLFSGVVAAACLTLLFGFARSEEDIIAKISAQLDKWLARNPQEKVYLQLDKPYYAIGDDIWFKAYITVNGDHQLSGLSGVLNVELINDQDSVKQSVKLPVTNGLAWGDFALADSLREGNYRIRAYTNWMRNAADEYFFDKTITIVNAISNSVFTTAHFTFAGTNVTSTINYTDINGSPYAGKPVSYDVKAGAKTISRGKGTTNSNGELVVSFASTTAAVMARINTNITFADKKTASKTILIKASSNNTDLRFFAEGGSLINGTASKIAFKAVGADGLGKDVTGTVIDDGGNQVATFASQHLGMGVFTIIPVSGKSYKANVTYSDGSTATVDLPKATDTGYDLNIDNSDQANVRVRITSGSANTPVGLNLVAQAGGVVYYAAKNKPPAVSFYAVIPKAKLPTGIVQFTLFSNTGEPLNERLVFIRKNDELNLNISPENVISSPRGHMTIGLEAKNKDSKPTIGSFSVAVTDENKVPVSEENENSIFAHLLLTSDLRGYVEKPNYYFVNVNQKVNADLDDLMLTQGYHRFEWKQVIEETYPAVRYQPERSLQISGHLKTPGGKPVANGKVTLLSTAGGMFLIDTVSGPDGKFTFRNLIFRDSVRFVIQARNVKNRKNVEIELDDIGHVPVAKNKNAPDLQVNISSGISPYLLNSKKLYTEQLKYGIANRSIVLKEVVIKEKKNQPLIGSVNLNGPGNADQVFRGEQLSTLACARLADCLQGRLTGVIFSNGIPYSTRSQHTPMEIVLDGLSVDPDILNDLNANDIESIEVLRSIGYTSIYGGRGGGGVLVITTKRGQSNFTYTRYAPGIITYTPKGYYKARVFYSPQYDDPKTNNSIPDLRSTIYWKPNIMTGTDGKASFSFFNADATGTYRVVIEGIDNDGNLGRKVYTYKVQ